MNLTNIIIKYFYKEESFSIISIILLSILLNFLKIAVMSYIISNIFKLIEYNNIKYVYQYYNYFFTVCIIFIILFYLYKYFQYKISYKIRFWIRIFLLKNILEKNDEILEHINFTNLSIPILRIGNGFEHILNMFMNDLIPHLTFILIIFFFFIYKNLNIGLIFLFGNLLLIFYLYYESFTIKNKSDNIEENIIRNESIISEIFNNFHKIILRGMQYDEIAYFKKDTDILYKISDSYYKYLNSLNIVCYSIVYTTLLVIVYYLIHLYFKKEITSVIFVTFITILLLYRDLVIRNLKAVSPTIELISRNNTAIKSFNIEIFNSTQKNINSNIKLRFNNIEFKNIFFKYKKNKNNLNNLNNLNDLVNIKLEKSKKIFNNFNLKLDIQNKIIGLYSLSGNGKSTLMKLLLKTYSYKGSILIDDININSIDKQYLRENIIYVDQSANLFDRKIIENIFYSCKNIDFSLMNKYLDEVMKYSKIRELYNNINFEENDAGFNGSNLSGGQRQVINIINGLITPSIITILDEPTNALDLDLKKEIIQLIKDFKKYNKCIIIITHDKDLHEILDEKIEI
jgi:ABC-type multidrug transport system fused ATPase/permease subunit